jgi:RNA polymerase sigma factor (sigma-70 family)
MNDMELLAELFRQNRPRLERVAFRVLGSKIEADDAVQEAWLRVARFGAGEVDNLASWLTTVVARVSLDVLRSRTSRREVPDAEVPTEQLECQSTTNQGEHDTLLADTIGPALLVVLETLAPAERVAFVLHDMFDLTFDEIAPIIKRSPVATRQLASRARRRVQLGAAPVDAEVARHSEIVRAFLAASRGGDLGALLAVLAPDVVLRADDTAIQTARATGWADLPSELRGAHSVAAALNGRARGVRKALIDGAPGAALVIGGEPRIVWAFVVDTARIVEIELLMDPESVARLDVSIDV